MRGVCIALLAVVTGACVRLAHIQETQPVRTARFSGSTALVARCIQQRLGGKVHQEAFGDTYVVYDSVKGKGHEGLTHYAITVRRIDAEAAVAEWRIMRPPRHGTSTGAYPRPPLSEDAVREFWTPVQNCTSNPA